MLNKIAIFSPQLIVLLKRLGIILLCFQLSRIIFLLANWANFSNLGFGDFFASIWFDIVTISLLGFPFIAFSLIPFSFRNSTWYQLFLKFLFHFFNVFFIALNLIDVVYFSFTQKRSTIDLLTVVGGGDDFAQQIGSFFKDFWLLLVFLIVLITISSWLNKKIHLKNVKFSFLKDLFVFVFVLASFVLLGRGGFRLKPISPIDASTFTRVENTALVLNTPFTMIKSINQMTLEEKNYFSLAHEQKLFNPIQSSNPQHLFKEKPNVVVIILESFGNEWVGAAGAKKSFTPFLDSLANESLYFVNGIANGKKSIEAVPCIVASIPSLLDNPYISSKYGTNKINSLATLLNKNNYETAFFHGATNGSMRFDGFAAQSGFKHYFGRKEYANDDHFDKTWGILDEYFNPWTAKKLSEFKKPFFATLFTLSSHHPYFIPKHLKGKLRKGPQQICESIHYGDYSLEKFFQEAKKQSWYDNTIFVICADHTSATNSEIYNQRTEIYKIPILFFAANKKILPYRETKVFQQMDILPTLLDLLNLDTKFYAYGKSYYNQTRENEAITYIEGTFNYFTPKHMMTFSNDKVRNFYNIEKVYQNNPDSLNYYKKETKKYENRLKAMIQRYNRDLIMNQMFVP
jgi:phosphoglycerol transferase MdoB-like AlkP superfamily enzyme